MSNPIPPVPAGPSTPGGTVRPTNQVQSQMTINTIMHNLPNLFGMHSRGELKEAQIIQLRQLMHTHFRQVIASSMAANRPNPLLNLPPAIDPTMPYLGRPPLVTKDAYSALINTTTQHLRETMAQRAQAQAQAQAQAAQNTANSNPVGNSNIQPTQQNILSTIPPPPQTNQTTINPTQTQNTPINTSMRPNQIPQGAVTSSGMANQNQNQNTAAAQNTSNGPTTTTTATGASNAQPMKLPPGILNFNTMNQIMRLTPEQRTAWLSQDSARISAFNLSAKYWANRTNANAIAAANAKNAVASSSGSTPPSQPQQQQQQQQQLPTTIAPKALITPPIPPTQSPKIIAPSSLQQAPSVPAPTLNPSSSTSTAANDIKAGASDPVKTEATNTTTPPSLAGPSATTQIAGDSKVDTKVVAPSTDKTQSDETKTSLPTTTSSESGKPTEAANAESTNTTSENTATKVDVGKDSTQVPTVVDPALPSAVNNPVSTTAPSFATALPDPKTFALKPPPPPPEPENVRRKRKCKEFIGELHPGLEMEYGMDEVIGDILDGLLDEGLKGATRLAKHRKSDKVELKDMAFFVDQCWGIENPGFDALGHTHRKTHIPPERERRKGKAVNPRAARLGRAREEE